MSHILKLLPAVAMVGNILAPEIAGETKKPHIILLMADQQRFDALGVMGNSLIKTPNLDGLAKDGVLFRNAYTSTPSSTPARAGLLTGCSPWRHGMLGYFKVAEQYPCEMPRMLRNAGYYTFAVGKVHYNPQRNLHGFHGALLDESGRAQSPDFVSDYRQWFISEAPGDNPDATGIGWNDHTGKTYASDERLHPTQWTGNEAIRFIENYHRDEPLFLKVSFARPHSPYDPPQRYFNLYRDSPVSEPWVGDWCGAFANRPETPDAAFGNFGTEHAIDSRRHYYASVTFVDDQIGRIIAALKEKGIYDNALIIFISDHGDMLGDHHHWRKTYAYEGSAHIPFIVKPPKSFDSKVPSGGSVLQPVEIRDVLPSFLDIAQIPQPSVMDGLSVLTLLENPASSWRPYIDLEHATCYEKENYWCALTDTRIKYIWFFHTGEEQLFDLSKDPHELKNLVHDRKYDKELLKWRQNMFNHLSERGDPFVKDGKVAVLERTVLTGSNYPAAKIEKAN
jgi:arylsulfatase A-like enzyme